MISSIYTFDQHFRTINFVGCNWPLDRAHWTTPTPVIRRQFRRKQYGLSLSLLGFHQSATDGLLFHWWSKEEGVQITIENDDTSLVCCRYVFFYFWVTFTERAEEQKLDPTTLLQLCVLLCVLVEDRRLCAGRIQRSYFTVRALLFTGSIRYNIYVFVMYEHFALPGRLILVFITVLW